MKMIRDVTSEQEAQTRLASLREQIREFSRKSNPITRTPELWDQYHALTLEAAYLEESLDKMSRKRPKSKPRTVWEKTRRKRGDDDDA